MRAALTAGLVLVLAAPGLHLRPARAQPLYDAASLERTYRKRPSPGILYQLARVAQAEGRLLEAADLYRRYLEEAGEDAPPRRQAEIREYLGGVHVPSGEVDVLGDSGAILSLDGRVVGALPLAVPLLVSPGAHRLGLESGRRHAETHVSVRALRRAEVRFTLDNEVAVVTLMPAVALLVRQRGVPASWGTLLAADAQRAVRQERVYLIPQETQDALLRAGGPCGAALDATADGPEWLACQQDLARRAEAHLVVLLMLDGGAEPTAGGDGAVPGPGGGRRRTLRLIGDVLDGVTGAVSARAERRCPDCDAAQAGANAADLLHQLLLQGKTRTRGTLAVSSVPPGAALQVDGVRRGPTPYGGLVLSGPHQVALTLSGYQPYQAEVQVGEGATAQVTAKLLQQVVVDRGGRGLRAAGWAFVGIGAGAVIGGGVLLGVDGMQDCSKAAIGHCPYALDTRTGGIVTLTLGGVAMGAGAAMLVVDWQRHRYERAAR